MHPIFWSQEKIAKEKVNVKKEDPALLVIYGIRGLMRHFYCCCFVLKNKMRTDQEQRLTGKEERRPSGLHAGWDYRQAMPPELLADFIVSVSTGHESGTLLQ